MAKIFDKIFRQKKFRRKIDKLPFFAELWIFGRNRQMRLEKLPPKFWFSTLYDFWRRGKRDSFNFCPRLSAKLTSTLFVFWLEDTCVPDDKIPEIAWTAHKGGSYLAVTPLLREGGLISRPRGVLMDRHRGDFNSEFQSKTLINLKMNECFDSCHFLESLIHLQWWVLFPNWELIDTLQAMKLKNQ